MITENPLAGQYTRVFTLVYLAESLYGRMITGR
jgi:hypothetical protein